MTSLTHYLCQVRFWLLTSLSRRHYKVRLAKPGSSSVTQNATTDGISMAREKRSIYRHSPASDWFEGEIPATARICNIVAICNRGRRRVPPLIFPGSRPLSWSAGASRARSAVAGLVGARNSSQIAIAAHPDDAIGAYARRSFGAVSHGQSSCSPSFAVIDLTNVKSRILRSAILTAHLPQRTDAEIAPCVKPAGEQSGSPADRRQRLRRRRGRLPDQDRRRNRTGGLPPDCAQ